MHYGAAARPVATRHVQQRGAGGDSSRGHVTRPLPQPDADRDANTRPRIRPCAITQRWALVASSYDRTHATRPDLTRRATPLGTSPTPVNAHCTRSLRNSSPRTTLLRRVARMRTAGAGSGIHARTAHTKYAHASPRPRWLRPRLRGVHPTSHVQIPRHGLCGRFKHPGAGAHKKCTLAAKPSKIRPGGRGARQPH